MSPKSTLSREFQFRPRSLVVAIAFIGLLVAAVVQTVRLERAKSREAVLRSELSRERDRAESNRQKALAAVDALFTRVEDEWTAPGTSRARQTRELLEQALKFYERMGSGASSPEDRTRALERVRQIRSQLGDKVNQTKGI
jgi:hypothetical protein